VNKYFGHILLADGLKIDPDKCRAIQEMETPKDKSERKGLLDMITYLSRYAPNLSEIINPLSEILKKGIILHWDSPKTRAFQKVKDILTMLSYFDPNKRLVFQRDSVIVHGCAATLMQDEKLIAFVSTSLTNSVRSLAMIKKQLLALVFGMTKFRQYI
jgi:hypothetical protein